jgi:thioredoxin reductase
MLDALIIGAGPAGASCALWLSRFGMDVMLADARPVMGGLLNDSPYRNDWIVTQPGMTGPDLAEGIGLSLAAAGVPMMLGSKARKVERGPDGFTVGFDIVGGRERAVIASHIVIATGVRARTGGFTPSDRVLIGPGAHIASYDFAGRSVAILGGGDNAFENYEFVKRAGATRAHIYARSIRASRLFVRRVNPQDIHRGLFKVDGLSGQVAGHGEARVYDVILVMFGWEPVPVFIDDLPLRRDEKGFVRVDARTCATSVEGVFAIGEAALRSHPSVVTAMADGIAAAKAIQRRAEGT